MNRQDFKEPDWTRDEDAEVVQDAEMADRFGFLTDTITAARNDLDTFLWTFHNNPFDECETLGNSLSKSNAWLKRDVEKLAAASARTDVPHIQGLIAQLHDILAKLEHIQIKLPRKPQNIQTVAVNYLISTWVYGDRMDDTAVDKTLSLRFNDSKPTHPSSQFVMAMLHRSKGHLRSVSASTVKRAGKKIPKPVPLPDKVYPFSGDVDLLPS